MAEFQVLGPLVVRDAHGVIDITGARRRALLLRLLVDAHDVVSTDRLAEDLWEGVAPPAAHSTLRSHISLLRSKLGAERVRFRDGGYVVEIAPDELDTRQFEREAREGRAALVDGRAIDGERLLGAALARWRGPAFADVSTARWALPEITRLEELRLGALESWLDALLALGRHHDVTAAAEAAVADNPLREQVWAHLMLALYRSGRQADALRAFQRLRVVLNDQLGLEPSPPLRALEADILVQHPRLQAVASVAAPIAATRSRGTWARPQTGAPFVGRTDELAAFAAALSALDDGRGRVVLLAGDAGIGKTRLAQEFATAAVARGASVLWGECHDGRQAPSYFPWRAIVSDAVDRAAPSPARAHELARLVPDALPGVEPSRAADEGARYRFFDAVVDQIAAVGRAVVVIDDLHWADVATLRLLEHATRALAGTPTVFVATYREGGTAVTNRLVATIASLARVPGATTTTLAGLDERDAAELAIIVGAGTVDAAAAASIARRSDGNPFFVHQLADYLPNTENGRAIPDGIRALIGVRLRDIGTAAAETLQVAAVLGRDFDDETVARVARLPVEQIEAHLDTAIACGLVEPTSGFRFVHALVREQLYNELAPSRRRALHRDAALDVRDGRDDRDDEVAQHWLLGARRADAPRVREACIRASRRASRELAMEEAVEWIERALSVEGPIEERERLELGRLLGSAQIRAGRYAEGRVSLAGAAELAERADDVRLLGEIALAYRGPQRVEAPDQRHVPLLRRALARLNGYDDDALRGRLLAHLADALDETDPERRESAERAAKLADVSGDPVAAYEAFVSLFWVHFVDPLNAAAASAAADAALDAARSAGDAELNLHAIQCRVVARTQLADYETVERDVSDAVHIGRRVGSPWTRALPLLLQGRLLLAEGDVAAAERKARQTVEFSGSEPAIAGVVGVQVMAICRWQRRLAEALVIIDAGRAAANHEHRNLLDLNRACVLADEGSDDARREAHELVASASARLAPAGSWRRPVELMLLADAAAELGDARTAATVGRLLQPWSRLDLQIMSSATYGPAALYLGRLEAARGRAHQAVTRLTAAARSSERNRQRSWMLLAHAELVGALIARGHPGDDARAEALAHETRLGAARLGLARVTHRLETVSRR